MPLALLQGKNLLSARLKVAAGHLQPPTSGKSTSGHTLGSGRTTAPSPAADVPSPAPQTTKTTWGFTQVSECSSFQTCTLDLNGDILFNTSAGQYCISLRIAVTVETPPSPQVRNRTCAQCLAARNASQNTPAFTNTTWSTHLANHITATTVGKPTSRSRHLPCTNARPTTTRSPSRRSRRPTSNPLQVSAVVTARINNV